MASNTKSQQPNIIPLDSIPQPWSDIIDHLQNAVFVCSSDPSEAELMNLWRVGIIMDIALHWVVKNELHKKHKIPYKPNLANVCKPLGFLMTCYLKLCKRLIELESAYMMNSCGSLPYQNAAEWFGAIYQEISLNSINCNRTTQSKTKRLKERRETLDVLKEGRNPVDKNKSPHEYRLIAACVRHLDLCEFDKNYWTPYLRAYSKWITAVDSSEWSSVVMRDGKLLLQQGQGKGKIRIPYKSHLLERLSSEGFKF